MTKKEKIIQVATEIFAKYGFLNTKIATIAKNAGIATGSVYLYFNNKDSILEDIYINSWATIEEHIKILLKKDIPAIQMFDEYFQFLFDITLENLTLVNMLIREQHFLNADHMLHLKEKIVDIRLLIAQMIQKGQKEDYFNKDIDPLSAAAVIMGGTWYYFVSKTESLSDKSDKEILKKQLLDIFMVGLRK